jgi:hypothetical protein
VAVAQNQYLCPGLAWNVAEALARDVVQTLDTPSWFTTYTVNDALPGLAQETSIFEGLPACEAAVSVTLGSWMDG